MSSRTVLFAGGPLHGRTMNVDGMHVRAVEPPDVTSFLTHPVGPVGPAPRYVTYAVSRFALLGHVIWIGHLGTTPDEALVFEVLTSDGAKAASCVPDPAFR
jgi:hypothetical protein